MKKLLLLCICCLGVFTATKSAVPDSSLAYETAIYHALTEVDATTLLWQKYHYQKKSANFEGAKQSLNRLTDYQPNNFSIYYEKALMHYLLAEYADFNLALNNMHQLDSLHEYTLVLTILQHVQDLNMTAAKLTFKKLAAAKGKTINIDSIFKPIENLKDKKEHTAAKLATFLPGTGHWYAGSFKHGALNASLILGMLGWGTFNVFNQFYVTGLLTGYFTAYTFYTGGITYTEKLLLNYNIGLRVKARNHILRAIKNI